MRTGMSGSGQACTPRALPHGGSGLACRQASPALAKLHYLTEEYKLYNFWGEGAPQRLLCHRSGCT